MTEGKRFASTEHWRLQEAFEGEEQASFEAVSEVSGGFHTFGSWVRGIERCGAALRDDSTNPCLGGLMERDAEQWKNTDNYCIDHHVFNKYCVYEKASKKIL